MIIHLKNKIFWCDKCKETFTLPYYCIHWYHPYHPKAPVLKGKNK